MKETNTWNLRDFFINLTVILIILIGIESILIGYNHNLEFLTDIEKYSFINEKTLQLHRILSVIIGFGLIFISYRLFKRMRMAWIISVCMVSILTFMHIFRGGRIFTPTTIIELMVIVILISNYKRFKRVSDPLSLRNGIILGLIVIAIIMLNTCFTIYVLKIKLSTVNGIYDAISNTIKMLFLIDPSVLGKISRIRLVIAKSGIVINWIGIIAAFIFILKPLVYQQIVTGYDKDIEAFEKMKLEEAQWGSLGLAPLANVAEDGKVAGRLLDFVYEKLNSFYGFKSLYHYKKKYGPTYWEPRYLVYYPKLFTPKIAYSIIKAQNPKGVGDFILTQLKSIFNVNKL